MNGRSLRSLPAGAFTIAVILIAVAALAAGNYAFAPPSGWTHVRSGTESKWLDPTGIETLTLFTTSYSGDLNSFVIRNLKQERSAYPTQYVWTNRNYHICGRHTARYVIWTASTHGRSMVWEQLFSLWSTDGYVVSYTRPAKNPPSTVARGSLLSICGVGTAPEQPGGVPVTPVIRPPAQGQPAPPPLDQPSPNPSATIPHPYVPVVPG